MKFLSGAIFSGCFVKEEVEGGFNGGGGVVKGEVE